MEIEFNLGIAEDPRSAEEKAKDFKHSDTAGDVIVEWKEKLDWKKYTPREQDGSLSCCGQSAAKAIEIVKGGVQSAHPIYRSRSNFPDGGMYLANVGECSKKVGTTTELLDPSQFQNETKMNRDIAVQTPTKIAGYAFPKHKDIEEIAQAIELHGQCLLIFHCNKSEWIDIPKFLDKEINFGHCICAVDYFLWHGQKVILIEDSTGHFNSFDKNGQRLITEDFLLKRCDGAMYLIPSKFQFTKTLKYGMKDPDVKELQRVLSVIQTGYFGKLTLEAVKGFQLKHHLVGDGIVGSKTNLELNKLLG